MADAHYTDKLMESDDMFGFIVMDGEGTLFGTLTGNTRQVLYRYRLFPAKKHGRGGEPALRFSRANFLKRINHARKTAELASMLYIDPNTRQPNVSGLILAGSVQYKTSELADIIDPILKEKIVNVVDVSYGGENGFNQAIELSSEILSKTKFAQDYSLCLEN
jgi:peptide chain release factor subunit 1